MAGTLALTFDDETLTILARWGAKVSHPHWPALLRGISPNSITARISAGGRIDITGAGFPAMVLHPTVSVDGQLDLQVRVESSNPAAIFNVAAPFVNRMVAKALNERIAKFQGALAGQGLHTQLTSAQTGAGLLTITVALVASA